MQGTRARSLATLGGSLAALTCACASSSSGTAGRAEATAVRVPTSAIAGVVHDLSDGSTVSFATLEAIPLGGQERITTETGVEGDFELRVAPGRYSVTARYGVLRSVVPDVIVMADQVTRLNLGLDPRAPPRALTGSEP